MKCPLCLGQQTTVLEVLDFERIKALYRAELSVELDKICDQVTLSRCEECDLRFYDPFPVGTTGFYSQLAKHEWYYLSEKNEFDIARRYLDDCQSLLEIGAGTGAFAEKVPHIRYMGLELNDNAAAKARSRGLNVQSETVETHVYRQHPQYDAVCSFQVLEHIPDARGFLSAAVSSLKPGGLMIHSVPSEDSFMGRRANVILNMPPHHATRWTDTALRNLSIIFDLEIVELIHEPLSNQHISSYCTQRIQTIVNRIFGRRDRTLDAAYSSVAARAITRSMSLPWEWTLRASLNRPVGHSVVAVYRKTNGERRSDKRYADIRRRETLAAH